MKPRNPLVWRLVGVLLIAALALSACEVLVLLDETSGDGSGGQSVVVAGEAESLAALPKPEPKARTWRGCPPEGDGGDPAMNRLKNRSDIPDQYYAVSFDTLLNLPWPAETERRDRDRWSEEEIAAIAQYEGAPIVVEGYFYGGKESGPETPNCHGTDNDYVDWHVWITAGAGEDRTRAIVIEPTPRVRVPKHPNWTVAQIKQIAKAQLPVRISGWLFYDPEHPDQIGQTRGTIWEIHPVTDMEVLDNGAWVSLDDWTSE